MQKRLYLGVVSISALLACEAGAADFDLCEPLLKFVESVNPDETRVLKLHTRWGGNFTDSHEPALAAKRCDYNDHALAKVVCEYFTKHGAIEFSGNNAKAVIACLSPGTLFAPKTELHTISLSMTYGTDDRGSLVDVDYSEDAELGGMVLSITVEGY
jgi:hypothetical protein